MSETDDPLLYQFFNEIGIIEQLARNHFEPLLPDGLKISQFSVLNHFARLGGEKSPQELARAFQVTKGAMTNTLQRLLARKLIHIRPDPDDGRAKRVTISEKGLTVRNQAVADLLPALQELEQSFAREEFAAAIPFLRRLRMHLDELRG